MAIFRRIQAVEAKILAVKEKAHFLVVEKQKFLSNNMLITLEASNQALNDAMIRSGCGNDVDFAALVEPVQVTSSSSLRESAKAAESPVAKTAAVAGATTVKKKSRKSLTAAEKKSAAEAKTVNPAPTPAAKTKAAASPRRTAAAAAAAAPAAGMDYLRIIPESKFAALPESTRGRVAHSDIVHTYRQLVEFIKQNTIVPHVEAQVAAAHTRNRRQSMNGRRASVCRPKVSDDLPSLEYSVRELSIGALSKNNPFQMEKESTAGRMPIKLTGKTGSCVLMSLRALGLVKLDIASSTRDALSVVLSDELETELLAFKHHLVGQQPILNQA
jgi:hypothetical protein